MVRMFIFCSIPSPPTRAKRKPVGLWSEGRLPTHVCRCWATQPISEADLLRAAAPTRLRPSWQLRDHRSIPESGRRYPAALVPKKRTSF